MVYWVLHKVVICKPCVKHLIPFASWLFQAINWLLQLAHEPLSLLFITFWLFHVDMEQQWVHANKMFSCPFDVILIFLDCFLYHYMYTCGICCRWESLTINYPCPLTVSFSYEPSLILVMSVTAPFNRINPSTIYLPMPPSQCRV